MVDVSKDTQLPVYVAVEPISTGTIVTLVSFIGGLVSTIILIVKIIVCYSLFVLIVFWVGANVFKLFGGFSGLVWLTRQLVGAKECLPVLPNDA